MELRDIYIDLIHDKSQKKLSSYEKELNIKIQTTTSLEDKEEIYFLLLVTKIEKSHLETVNIKHILMIYLSILDKIELSKKFKVERFKIVNRKKNHVLVVFYNTIISRLHYLENLYSKNYSSDYNKNIRRRKYDYKKELYFHNNEKGNYLVLGTYKRLTGYGDGIENLALTSGMLLFFFAFIFYIYDFNFPGTLTTGFPGMENVGLASFEYYIYLSTNIFSNLGADGNLAVTPYLRFLFDIEQVLGVLSFGLFIFIMGKKL